MRTVLREVPLARCYRLLAAAVLLPCTFAGCDQGPHAIDVATLTCDVESADMAPPPAAANDQRNAGGVRVGDTLHIALDARAALLLPEGEEGPRLTVQAFGETGMPTSVPGPLIRAPVGTTVLAHICNALPDTLWLIGLSADDDTATVPPGIRLTIAFPLAATGMTVYRGLTRAPSGGFRPAGPTGQLAGAIVADGEERWGDRVLVITDWAPPPGDAENQPFALLVNGRSWPHTERLRYDVGDTARWIVVNASPVEHPMHLHGFHFLVTARSNQALDSIYPADRRRLAVTETLLQDESMALEWVPERGGRWLLHCHIASHMDDVQRHFMHGTEPPAGADVHAAQHAQRAMAGLVVGIEIAGDPVRGLSNAAATRSLRLVAQQRERVFGEESGFGYVLDQGHLAAPDSIVVPGPPIVLTRAEAAAITIVNRLPVATTVHWHGIEIESYFDGVPGWTGDARRTTPLIQPGDSFAVRITPPRAGTFIYHSHADEGVQLARGPVGPVIVLDSDQAYDPATDHVLLFHVAGTDPEAAVVANGLTDPEIVLEANRTHRIRLINITAEDLVSLEMYEGETVQTWSVVARDGADMPAALRSRTPARLVMGPGQTVDVVITPQRAGELRIGVQAFNDFEVRIRVVPGPDLSS